jgi:hypothetical protein
MKITSNYHSRPVFPVHDLSPSERSKHDINADSDDSFFRYRGDVYPLSEFVRIIRPGGNSPHGFEFHDHENAFIGWDGIRTDSFFSAIVIRLAPDGESAIVGLALC